MTAVRHLLVVVGNLLAELWIGNFRKSNFYDSYTYPYKRTGRIVFNLVVLAVLVLLLTLIIRMGR